MGALRIAPQDNTPRPDTRTVRGLERIVVSNIEICPTCAPHTFVRNMNNADMIMDRVETAHGAETLYLLRPDIESYVEQEKRARISAIPFWASLATIAAGLFLFDNPIIIGVGVLGLIPSAHFTFQLDKKASATSRSVFQRFLNGIGLRQKRDGNIVPVTTA